MKIVYVAAAILFATPSDTSDSEPATPTAAPLTLDGIEYGSPREFSGVYFTNFENSKFTECNTPTVCNNWVNHDQEWVNCQPSACQDLQSKIQRLNGPLDKWGAFNIVFVGRRSTHSSKKEFLNDAESKVLIERILRLDKRPS